MINGDKILGRNQHCMAFVKGARQPAGATPSFRSSFRNAFAIVLALLGLGGFAHATQQGAPQEIPLRGFYVAHLLSGSISTTIDGETTKQPPGAYWAVKAGAAMQVRVLGEFAVLETIVTAKQ
jgi:hypothetical protein